VIFWSGLRHAFRASLPAALILALGGCSTLGTENLSVEKDKTAASEKGSAEEHNRIVTELNSAIDKGQFADAQMIIRRLQSLDAAKSQIDLANAEIELSQGRYNTAAAIFRKLLSATDLSARAHQGLGLVLLLVRKPEEARGHLENATKLDANLWRAWNGLGYYFDLQRNWKRAEECYLKALDISKYSAKVVNNIGFSRLMQARYDDAVSDFRKALQLDSNLGVAKTNLRIALAWQGKYEEALSTVRPNELPRALNNVGYIAMLKGEYVLAEAYFTRAMELNPAYDARAATNLRRLNSLKSADKK
jgi:Flp pilus assembly protein TadD